MFKIISARRPWYKVNWKFLVIALAVFPLAFYVHTQTNKPLAVEVTGGPVGQGKSLKSRMIFLDSFERSMRKKGYLATLDLAGEDGKTLVIFWDGMSYEFARQMVKSKSVVTDLREMGFKRLIMKNSKKLWDVDLKN